MTEVFEYSEDKRENLIYHFATMDEKEVGEHEANRKQYEIEAAAQRAKQAAARTAPGAAAPTVAQKQAGVPQAGAPQAGANASGVKPPPFLAAGTAARSKPSGIKPVEGNSVTDPASNSPTE
jgi:hypothetical protein